MVLLTLFPLSINLFRQINKIQVIKDLWAKDEITYWEIMKYSKLFNRPKFKILNKT